MAGIVHQSAVLPPLCSMKSTEGPGISSSEKSYFDFFVVVFYLFSSPFREGSQHLPTDQISLRALIPVICDGFSFK